VRFGLNGVTFSLRVRGWTDVAELRGRLEPVFPARVGMDNFDISNPHILNLQAWNTQIFIS
jgi:hypothetical protein